jgi:hypothetical protein
MSSEKHPNLQLHKWAPTDYVKREEWNENFGIIDDKIGILNKKTSRISVMEFGAVGDGVTDDRQKIIDAINACVALKGTNKIPELYFPYCNGYAVSGTITVPAGISVIMDAPIVYIGTVNEPCLIIGEASSSNTNVTLKLQVERSTLSDWSSENNVGIRLINTSQSEIEIIKANKFTIGVQCQGDSKGFAYNDVKLFSLNGNKIAVDLTSKNAGWCNENNFYGGRFSVSTGQNNGLSRYGVRITSADGYIQNNNHFIKPSFELQQSNASPGEALPVLIEYGSQNTFRACRNESNGTIFARILNNSTENYIHIGYGSQFDIIDDQSNYPATKFETNKNGLREQSGKLLFQISNIQKRACYYDGNSNIHVAGVHMAVSSNSSVYKTQTSLVINDDYLEIPSTRGIGVFVDTRKNKRFLIRREVISGYGGRVAIRCYDSNGVLLTDNDPNHPYVKGNVYAVLSYTTFFGSSYRSGLDNELDYYITVHNDVAKIEVIFCGGTNPCKLRGFSIATLDSGHASVYPGYDEIIPGMNLAITPPTAGTWKKGKVVLNDNKTVLGTSGSQYVIDAWECIADGTPGTWIQKRTFTGT